MRTVSTGSNSLQAMCCMLHVRCLNKVRWIWSDKLHMIWTLGAPLYFNGTNSTLPGVSCEFCLLNQHSSYYHSGSNIAQYYPTATSGIYYVQYLGQVFCVISGTSGLVLFRADWFMWLHAVSTITPGSVNLPTNPQSCRFDAFESHSLPLSTFTPDFWMCTSQH